MFWMFPITAVAYLDQGQLTDSARQSLRRAWRTYMPYRGDTENHWLLYYSTLYLMAQLWPDQQWYNGKTSAENMQEATGWIESWVRLTTRRGQGEYDSPHYIGVFLLPMSYLAEWARDPAMKTRARMMLDYLIADYAAENLGGIHVGAESRVYERQALEKSLNPSSYFGWTLFGLGHQGPSPDSYVFYYLLASAYEPPEIIKAIATDRSQPYVHYERKRTRNRWRFFDEVHGPVYKTTYVRARVRRRLRPGRHAPADPGAFLGRHVARPRRRAASRTRSSRCIRIRRCASSRPTSPSRPTSASRPSSAPRRAYDSPDKFVGGSPYEQIFQDHDTVIALYDIPPETRFPHINGFFSKDLARSPRRPVGLDFRAGRRRLDRRAILPTLHVEADRRRQPAALQPALEKTESSSRRPPAPSTPTSTPSAEPSSRCPSRSRHRPCPRRASPRSAGRRLEFTYGQTPRVDGQPLNYDAWPLFGGPFLEAPVDSERLTIKHGPARRELDFRTLTTHESRNPGAEPSRERECREGDRDRPHNPRREPSRQPESRHRDRRRQHQHRPAADHRSRVQSRREFLHVPLEHPRGLRLSRGIPRVKRDQLEPVRRANHIGPEPDRRDSNSLSKPSRRREAARY